MVQNRSEGQNTKDVFTHTEFEFEKRQEAGKRQCYLGKQVAGKKERKREIKVEAGSRNDLVCGEVGIVYLPSGKFN